MGTRQSDIRDWFLYGKEQKATHMIVMCDTFDYEDYPVYVKPGHDVREIENQCKGNMQQVMEVYNLAIDMEMQLNQHRAFNY